MLAEVRLAVHDWRAMLDRVNTIVDELKTNPPPLPREEVDEAVQFVQWLLADNFTFLGVRNYTFDGNALTPEHDTSLGIMRERELRVLKRGNELLEYTPEIMAFLKEPRPLIIAKANIHARVHRRAYLDYIGVKRFDAAGNLIGEQRIVGLFTSTAYTRSAHGIPYLRRKLAAVEERAGFAANSHSGKALANVLEHYPRDELFQVDVDTLYRFALAILQLDEHPRVRVLARRDRFDRFVSVLVYVPRENYDSQMRVKIGEYLASVFLGRVSAFYPYFPEGPLVRVHFIIGRSGGATPEIERTVLEDAVAAIVRSWADAFYDDLTLVYPPEKARELFARYREAFSEGFHEAYSPAIAAGDVRVIEGLSAERPLGVDFHHRLEEEQRAVGLKVWSLALPLPLSERVPVLENMGFRVVDERTYHIAAKGGDGREVWFHDMLLERGDGGAIDLTEAKAKLETAFLMVMRGAAENDGYNALTLAGGVMWRDVALIRALSRYLRQVRVPYSQDYMWATLVKHAGIAAEVVALFHARFDPGSDAAKGRADKQKEIAARIEEALQNVESLDEDRILRHFVNAVQSAIRTNYFQPGQDGQPKPLIAIKFESRKITDLPLPRPLYEIFVYSPRLEAVHLRFGKVARGGIRWSDRPQDFRTEVLGLVKAQQVKNAVIVPVGAKGGFVPKLMPKGAARDVMHGRRRRHLPAVHVDHARHHRQYRRRRQDHSAARRGAPRRRRSLSGGGRRQGHRHLLRHRQRDFSRARLLAGRRLRLRRLRRLRPQGDGHHGARRLGGGEAAFPRDGCQHPHDAVHRGRRRRHVGRRVRQRHAARGHHQAGRRLRPSRHFHRPRSRSEKELRRAQAAVRIAALELAGLRQEADLQGRRRLQALAQGDPSQRAGAEAVRRRRGGDAAGA